MNNSSEKIHIQKASEKLAQIRQPVGELLALVPNLIDIDSIKEIGSKEKSERALSLAIRICGSPSINLAALPSMISVKEKDRENFDWYKNKFPVIRKKAIYLMKRALLPSWDGVERAPDRTVTTNAGKKIKLAFSNIADFAEQYLDGLDGEEFERVVEEYGMDAGICKFIIDLPYFQPDEWFENGKFSPITITKDLKKVPIRIRQRVEEIRHSFIFGNWIAVIALSRCLLEYALVERKHVLKIEAYRDKEKTRVRALANLIEDAGKTLPELEGNMSRVKDAGNDIMHPSKTMPFPPNKNAAKKCIDDIAKIIGVLYSE